MDRSKSGATSGGLFAVLYAFLYLLVVSDDYALLAGALGLFAVLAAAMLLTRKVNWYQTV
jgi:inner membrane protein